MTCRDATELVAYWLRHPPTHVVVGALLAAPTARAPTRPVAVPAPEVHYPVGRENKGVAHAINALGGGR